MTDTCHYCGAEIMLVGSRWYKKRTADVNGYCSNSPYDLHSPERHEDMSQTAACLAGSLLPAPERCGRSKRAARPGVAEVL
jgi:hypothetical protein